MHIPIEEMLAELRAIHNLVIEVKQTISIPETAANPTRRKVVTVEQLCEARPEIVRSTVYKKTSSGEIPHAKRGRRLYFDLDEIDAWLLANKCSTKADAEREAANFLAQRRPG